MDLLRHVAGYSRHRQTVSLQSTTPIEIRGVETMGTFPDVDELDNQ